MHYYEHHLGDYAAATTHLSWDEDMAYQRLIRAYYHTEKPIPLDVKDACRLVRASTSPQKKAVETVLREFFCEEQDGWHQKRCDAEIAHCADKKDKASRSANARWEAKRLQEERIANAMRTQCERIANEVPTQCEGNAPNPNPNPNPNPTLSESEATAPVSDKNLDQEMRKCADLAIPLREAGVQVSSMHPVLVAWAKDGFSVGDCMGALAIARQTKGENSQIHANYLDKILRDPRPKLNGARHVDPPRKAKEFGS